MRKVLLLLLLANIYTLHAQQFSRLKIEFDASHNIQQLAELGLDVDHGRYQPGKYFIGEFDPSEIQSIQSAGFKTQVLVADLQGHRQLLELHAASQTGERSQPPCPSSPVRVFETPANYVPGTMGGYIKYQEMLDMLDQMAAQYPNLIKAREPITTAYATHDGNPLYWLRISDNPDSDEAEPELLYTALHHAREPNSLSQMLFYMWYLLENYGTDPEVTYLVDNTEMYFVPCMNPDGYLFNESTNPDGGGNWRKNRRNNGDGTFGVDLNRNYGYQWGFDNQGSSPNTNSATYRGPAPFSEPETQMIKEFCEAHQFRIALNYHTYGNLLIYPWGWTDGPTLEHATFSTFGPFMARENDFLTGFATQTVGYTVNGTSDDWMYGSPHIYAMTPEVGPADWGFWPPSTEIEGLNKACMTQNLSAAHLVLNFGVVTPGGDRYISQPTGEILFSLKKMGLMPGQLTVSLEPVSDNIAGVGTPKNYGMLHLEEASSSIPFSLKPEVQVGDLIKFNLVLYNGLYQWRTPVELVYTNLAATAFFDEGSSLTNWQPSGWGLTGEHFYSTPSSITDSPSDNYDPNSTSEITMASPINIKDATNLTLSFWARWDIEEDEDYAQILGSFNGQSYQALCGKYTEAGTDEQAFDEPLYDGLQQNWVREEIDLTNFLGLADSVDFQFAFRVVSDEFIEKDGFYFDDMELTVVYEDQTSSTFDINGSKLQLSVRPNPVRQQAIIELKGEGLPTGTMQLQVFDQFGKLAKEQSVQGQLFKLDTADWVPGIYQYRLLVGSTALPAGRFIVTK